MDKENYYLSYYQAVLDQNVTKAAEFAFFNEEEEDNYLSEYPEQNYTMIFKNKDPDDVIEKLLKSKEYKDFYSLLILEKKALAENYYIALYQAILEKNITKVTKLRDLTSKEKLNYPKEYPNLNYDELFQDKDPSYILIALWKNEEFQTAYALETKKNYYLSFYQAILDKNLTKLVELEKLTSEEKANYPEEYTDLDANEIFQDNNPVDFINSLFRTAEFEDFYLRFNDARNPLATEENIAMREKKNFELMQNPLIDYCPNNRSSIIDQILSVSYSKVITKEEVMTKLTTLINQSDIINDILSVFVASFNKDSSKVFSIVLIGDNIQEYDPTYSSDTGGYYLKEAKRLIATNENAELNLEFIIHELAHKAMDDIFNNDSSPYSKETKNKYHLAIKNTLLNIQKFIQQDFDLNISFEDRDDTWQMGKTLSSMLFPQYLEGDRVQEFVSLFKEHNLNIDDQFSWLNGDTPLNFALRCLKFELADFLVAAGATIIQDEAMNDVPEIMNWFLENKQNIDINYQDIDSQNEYEQDTGEQYEDDATIREKQLDALEKLLDFYNQDYDENNEDEEFIARFTEISAGGLYKGKIVEVLEPLAEYWKGDVSLAAAAYQEQYDW